MTSVIQGASRGIGLALCSRILTRSTGKVIALCRKPNQATNLLALRQKYPERLIPVQLDLNRDENHFQDAAKRVESEVEGIDLFINSSGILSPSGRGETSLRSVTPEALAETYRVNTVGPLLCAKHFSHLLSHGSGNFGHNPGPRPHSSVFVNISARVGSISDNNLGGWYSYRLSKAALNMTTKNLSIELKPKGVVCVGIHPGTVDTDLSAPYHKNVRPGKLFSRDQAAGYIMDIIDGLDFHKTGQFFAWDGTKIEY